MYNFPYIPGMRAFLTEFHSFISIASVKASILCFHSSVCFSNSTVVQDTGISEMGKIQYDINWPTRWDTPNYLPNAAFPSPALFLEVTQS